MIFCRIWLLQARINIIKPLRGFNCGGDNSCYKYLLQLFATIMCYNYVTSTKSNKIKIVQVYKIISQMFDYCNDDG
jgi:hypothetical protein